MKLVILNLDNCSFEPLSLSKTWSEAIAEFTYLKMLIFHDKCQFSNFLTTPKIFFGRIFIFYTRRQLI